MNNDAIFKNKKIEPVLFNFRKLLLSLLTCRYVEVFVRGNWQVLCDEGRTWGLQESNVACRQMGYEDGAAHFHRGNATRLGDLRRLLAGAEGVLAVEQLECTGEERHLDRCAWRLAGGRCEPRTNAVALVCTKPSPALCPRDTEPFGCAKIGS